MLSEPILEIIRTQLCRWMNAAPETQLKPVTPGAIFWRAPIYDSEYKGYEDVELNQYYFWISGHDLFVYAGYAPVNQNILYWHEESK